MSAVRIDLDMLTDFFADYGQALSDGDAATIAGCYRVPALVLSDAGSVAISAAEEIEAYFDGHAEQHRARGLVTAQPSVRGHWPLTGQLVTVDVVWSYLDAEGTTRQREAYRYLLRVTEDEGPLIQVVVVTDPAW
ncbi:hypothetical protein HUO13_20265 [Saccharopolyspora erythraea]|uniref:hypothetical protein n=1 Tax=Saccharopolyspora erythraea TaxID=1836 RepID=UPI001BA5A184|nr:hypothetical protein [Saccharopolyspora erythraea]QUH02834.1 hypothetical protein HUO13_20265 [Saccharopolyspora erythraea]